jgi:hypothetical protein
MVILHTEICEKKEKLEKNYLHLYLTIFLNKILMLTSEKLAEAGDINIFHAHVSHRQQPPGPLAQADPAAKNFHNNEGISRIAS